MRLVKMTRCKRALIALFLYLLFFAFFWALLYTTAPKFVQYQTMDTGCNDDSPDPFRCILYALIFALIIIVVFYLIESKFWE